MEKCYKVTFTATLQKLTLALKIPCQIEVVWKRGQKLAQSNKNNLINGVCVFDKNISISCNMIYDLQSKKFLQKMTKFSILLYSEKGTKQAGQIEFDVAKYMNQKQLSSKKYQLSLNKCPDKNSKLFFSIKGVLNQEKAFDQISQSSMVSINVENLAASQQNIAKSTLKLPTSQKSNKALQTVIPQNDNNNYQQKIKQLQKQNQKIKQQLKNKQKLKKQNDQIKLKIKQENYKSVQELKQKIQQGKKQLDGLKQGAKNNKQIQLDIKIIQEQICKCKFQIMTAFNYAFQVGGHQLVQDLNTICGFKQH